ncbi:unnamed protein product [Prorocentrum cordatum]|uniref:Spindle pole body component n=1 Tax=Prorocentrum cordatum TaxID=2364126 RepID=A0ABN9SEX7_9DINO|nr:unnamed protein product [Polarella glacialis]
MVAHGAVLALISSALLARAALALSRADAAERRAADPDAEWPSRQLLAGSRADSSAKVLARAARLTEQAWMRSGPSLERDLRNQFVSSVHVERRVRSRCAADPTGSGDCAWQQEDSLLCEALELTGLRGELGNWTVLEQATLSALSSAWVYGVDPATRGAMLARWRTSSPQPLERSAEEQRLPYRALEARLLGSPRLRRRAEEACDGLGEIHPGCQPAATRALLCQAVGQASAVLVGLGELSARLEAAVVLQGSAADVIDSGLLERLGARTRQLLHRAFAFDMGRWLQSGSAPWRALKNEFLSNAVAMQEAKRSCQSLSDHDCVLRRLDPLLCDRLLGASSLATPEIERGVLAVFGATRERLQEEEQVAALQDLGRDDYLRAAHQSASRVVGAGDGLGPPVEEGPPADDAAEAPEAPQGHERDASIDCDARSLLIAKWEETRALPQPQFTRQEAPLEGMLRRLQATEVARSLTEHTCRDAGEVLRPGCWTTAPRHLFCEALGQTAARAHGTGGLLRAMGLGA